MGGEREYMLRGGELLWNRGFEYSLNLNTGVNARYIVNYRKTINVDFNQCIYIWKNCSLYIYI